ncbi:unnamed protein product [Cylicocyclus nassatus]|uniref:Uncharacterized protein n=1 Tax=Cylicocyclus nassatus TaxID=53992 RepID=A0AA36H3E4_CYLNA|nr:unnamed protein product [Cylicocyclus nassatus]
MKQAGLIDLLNNWKLLYPLANAFLCCVQPWMCAIFNEDVQKRLKKKLGCRRNTVNGSIFFISSASGVATLKA